MSSLTHLNNDRPFVAADYPPVNLAPANDQQRAYSALMSLDAGLPRTDWAKIGMAAKSAGLTEDDFISWSRQAANFENEADCKSAWKSFKIGGGIGAGTLFQMARDAGWRDNSPHTHQYTSRPQVSAPAPVKTVPSVDVMAVWNACTPAPDNHPYIVKKHGSPDGLRVRADGALAVPCWQDKTIQTIQFISEHDKKNLAGASFGDGYFPVGKIADTIYICEGIGQAWTANQATGQAAVSTFGVGRTKRVIDALRARYSAVQLVIVADAGQEAAMTEHGLPVVKMPDGTPKNYDINDHAIKYGMEAALALLDAPQRPPVNSNAAGDTFTPEPLPELPAVAPFDYAYLPTVLHAYVKDISERMQSPPDFAAVAAIVMLSSIIGRKVGIRPKREDNWTITPNLWGAIIGSSGVKKSPSMSAALAPLRGLQAKAIDAHGKAEAEMIKNLELGKMKQSVNKAAAKKRLAKDGNADVSDLMQIDEPEEVSVKRYSTNDVTYEKLGALMEQNPNGLLAESDELIGLLKKLDSQGQESARGFFLTAADGDKPYTFDRIMRGTLHLPAVCLSIIGGIQPGILADYVRQAVGGGAGADGLLQRFGLMVYPDIDPQFKYVDRKQDHNARASMDELVSYFDDQLEVMVQGEIAEYGDTIQFLRFDDEAQEIFIHWYSDQQQQLRSGDEHEAIVSHLSKYASLIPSLALIFHLCEHRRGAVDKTSLLRAIAYGQYLETHARRVYSSGTRPDIAAAKSLLGKITKGTVETPFTARDVYRHCWAGLETAPKAQAAIKLLCEYQHLIERTEETAGRGSTHYFHNRGK
ncbi:MAG: DUF3987 domain-containing protein [Sulfuriferula sp.]